MVEKQKAPVKASNTGVVAKWIFILALAGAGGYFVGTTRNSVLLGIVAGGVIAAFFALFWSSKKTQD